MVAKKAKLGFIGHGWIGKNMADYYEGRSFEVVRYGLEPDLLQFRDEIAACDIVFIAVPTPTTPDGFDASAVEDALTLVGDGKTAVIKSTILMGTTDRLSASRPSIYLFHSPEFLRERSVRHDIENPTRNIVGIPQQWLSDQAWRKKADDVMSLPPLTASRYVCSAVEAEMIKYGSNAVLYVRVVTMNMLHDLSAKLGASWDVVSSGMAADPRIGSSHMIMQHQSNPNSPKIGRGAGGHCFIKDFAAIARLYRTECSGDHEGIDLLSALEGKNRKLLLASGKDLDILTDVYGG